MRTFLILLAGGKGTRMSSIINKVLLPLEGKSVIRRSAEAFHGLVDEVVVVCHETDTDRIRSEVDAASLPVSVRYATGGSSRQASVRNGLNALRADAGDIVLVHDGARCLVSPGLIRRVISSVQCNGSGIPGLQVSSTYKLCSSDGTVQQTVERSRLVEAQTPQGFLFGTLTDAFHAADLDRFEGTDDASLLEHAGFPVFIVDGEKSNIKLTTPDDMILAENYLNREKRLMRIGMGYDVHRLAEGRKLILCGIEIPWDRGLLGHSDADVALHALMDALLGACAMGDIGRHFPDTDPGLEGVSSMVLLERTMDIIRHAGYIPGNADITIVAQRPKLSPFIPAMKEKVAPALGLQPEEVNIKATTTEKLGFEGREEGISAYAVCTVRPA